MPGFKPGFTYKSYSFIDKDPIIDYIRTIIQESDKSLTFIAYESGVNQNTISNWLYGETKRPQAATLNAVLRVLSKKLDISDINAPMIIIPTHYTPTPKIPVAVAPTKKRLGATKYVNVHRISSRRK
jgi:transcriptional regulator with XRE-family HTH domain